MSNTGKTTSSTVVVKDWSWIFFNRPDNNDIEYIRFKTPRDATRGKIGSSNGSICANTGAIAAIADTGSTTDAIDIRLYYISPGAVIKETKLPDAHLDGVNPDSGWIEQGSDLTFEKDVPGKVRCVDTNTFLSASISNDRPLVTFADQGEGDAVVYCCYTEQGFWANTTLKF